jgi:hypothetical protein
MKVKIIFFLSLAFASYLSIAQWSDNPLENTPIAVMAGEEAIPKIATSASGTSYVAWFSNEAGNYNVRLQKLDVNGVKMWSDDGLIVSNHQAMTWLTDWDMAVDHEEHAILTFQDIRTGNNNIFAYRISPDGEFAWGANGLQLSNSPTAFNVSPKVIVTDSNNVVIAWQADDVIIRQKVTPSGQKLWGDDGITMSGTNTFSWPQLLAVGDDEVIMKYFEDSGVPWAPTRHVYAQRYDQSGNGIWTNPTVISNAGGISAWTQIFSFIGDGNDGFFIAWHDDHDNNMLASVFVQQINASGQAVFPSNGVEASLMPGRNNFYPHLALPEGSDEVFVFWNEMDGNQDNRGIYGQKISSAGARLWTNNGKPFVELSPTDIYPFGAEVSPTDMTVFFLQSSVGNNAHLKAMRIATDGSFVWNDQIIALSSVQSNIIHPVVNQHNSTQWITVWEDTRNGQADIYGQNIQTDGTLGPVVFQTDLTIVPDSLICDVAGPHFVKIYNNTPEDVIANDIWLEEEMHIGIWDIPLLPLTIETGDSLILELWVIGGVKPLEPDQYEYDKLWIDSEAGLYHVDIAINWDLLGSAAENINQNFSLKVYPNPANHHVTFSLTGYESAEAELEIHDITGRAVIVIPVISGLSASWNLTGKDGARVKPGHYVFRLVSNQRVHTGRIVITE